MRQQNTNKHKPYLLIFAATLLVASFFGLSSAHAAPSPDINGDACVQEEDFALLQSDFGRGGAGLDADLVEDEKVDVKDLAALMISFNASCQPAEKISACEDPDMYVTKNPDALLAEGVPPEKIQQTVTAAVNSKSQPRTICVLPGEYQERVTIKRSGTAAEPFVIEGKDGAVINGGNTTDVEWEPALRLDTGEPVGEGVYMAELGFPSWKDPKLVYLKVDGTYRRIPVTKDALTDDDFYATLANGPLVSNTNCCNYGDAERTFDGILALAGQRRASSDATTSTTYIHLPQGIDPNSEGVELVFNRSGGESTIRLINTKHVVLRNLQIENGSYGVEIRNSESAYNIVEDSVIRGGVNSVLVQSDARHNTVRNNQLGTYFISTLDTASLFRWNIWGTLKKIAQADQPAIRILRAGSGNKIIGNEIRESFDGVRTQVSGTPFDKPAQQHYNSGTKVLGNTLSAIADDALYIGSGDSNSEWKENAIDGATTGIRIVGVYPGPLYVGNNRIVSLAQNSDCLNFAQGTPGEIYFYHNSCQVDRYGVYLNSSLYDRGAENTWLLNNVFSSRISFAPNAKWDSNSPELQPKIDYNWLGGAPRLRSWLGENNVVALNEQIWPEQEEPSFLLPADSAARQSAINLSLPQYIFDTVLGPLSGTRDYYLRDRNMGVVQ